MKRLITFIMCLLLAAFPSASTVLAAEGGESSSGESSGVESSSVESSGGESSAGESSSVESSAGESSVGESIYEEYSDTIYEEPDEDFIVEDPIDEPDVELLVPEEPEVIEEEEADLYGDESFDRENAAQLSGEYVLDEIIIKFVDSAPGHEKQLQKEIEKLEKVGFVEVLGAYIVKVDELTKNPNAILNKYKNNKYVEYVEPNYIAKFDIVPTDQYYKTYQNGSMNALNAPAGWDIVSSGPSAVVAIVDSGIVVNHSDMPKLLNGYSAVSGLAYGNDTVGHGTNVTGVLGAIGNNGIGGVGINWNASIMPVKVDDANGNLTVANIAKGIIWAADNGAKIINLSLGTTSDSVTLKNSIDYAYNKGCAIFAATGNTSNSAIDYPARYPNVMAVGATTDGKSRASYSNYGAGLDVVALGSCFTTSSSGVYASVSGTSFASPQVAGLTTLMLELNPYLTPDQIYDLIRQGAKPLGSGINDQTGYGLIDIGKTLELTAPTGSAAEIPQYQTPPVIILNSFTELNIYVGDKYQEMGYTATDCLGKDITANVKVTGTVDTTKAGLCTLTYTVTDDGGNTAKATRTINVAAIPVEAAAPTAPKITIIGSNPIILHLNSETPYKEQGAKAVDSDGNDISNLVEIIGQPDRNTAGTYTVTYKVVDKNGLEATTTREVRILAPNAEIPVRTPYGFSGQAKAGSKVTHTGIKADAFGYMDLTVKSIDKNMTITVQLIDTSTSKAVLTDTFSATGTKQYMIDEGKYELVVTIDKANGNSKYSIDLLMPEVLLVEFAEEEVPLGWVTGINESSSQPAIFTIIVIITVLVAAGAVLIVCMKLRRRRNNESD